MLLVRWLKELVEFYEDRLLYVDGNVAEEWGRFRTRRGAPVIDTLLAATARVHELTIVTRNTRDFRSLDVTVLNPWRATGP
jgi:predicted nucleic acid-binding protein